MAIKQIKNIDIEPNLFEIERVNKSIAFIAAGLPYYPHEGGLEELETILESLSRRSEKAVNEIKTVAALN
jgi:hypothetical protein